MFAVQIDYASDHHSSDFDLRHRTEMLCLEHGILSAVFGKHAFLFERGGLYSMEPPLYEHIFAFYPVVEIKISMIVLDGKSENKTESAAITRSEFPVFQKRFYGILKSLDFEFGFVVYFIKRKLSVARRDERSRRTIERAKFGFYPSRKKCIKTCVILLYEVRHIDVVLFDVFLYFATRKFTVEIFASNTGKRSPSKQP